MLIKNNGSKPLRSQAYLLTLLGVLSAGGIFFRALWGVIKIIRWLLQRARQTAVYSDNVDRIEHNRAVSRLAHDKLFARSDAEHLDMIMPEGGEGGLYLGRLDPFTYLRWLSDEHIFLSSAAGSFKTWSLTSVNVISVALGPSPESAIVLDLKGDLYAATQEGRTEIDGVEAIRIAPFERGGVKVSLLGDLVRLAEAGELAKEDCLAKMEVFISAEERRDRNGWIADEAVRCFAPMMAWLASEEYLRHKCHLGEIADLTTLSIRAFRNVWELMSTCDALDGWIAEEANVSLEKYAPDSKGAFDEHTLRVFGYMMEKAKNAFALYSKGSRLRDFVAVDPTDPSIDVWDPGRHKQIPHAAYLIFPPIYVRSHGQFASVFFDYVIRSLRDAKGHVRTTLMLDEIGNFPQVMAIPEALMLLRSYGIRIFAAVQDRLSLKTYDKVGGAKLFESQSIQLLSTVSDTAHAQEIEKRAGYHTEVTPSYQTSIGTAGNVGSISGAETRVANLSVHEIGMIGKRHAIFVAPGIPVGIFERPVYYEIPWIKDYVKDIRGMEGHTGLNHG